MLPQGLAPGADWRGGSCAAKFRRSDNCRSPSGAAAPSPTSRPCSGSPGRWLGTTSRARLGLAGCDRANLGRLASRFDALTRSSNRFFKLRRRPQSRKPLICHAFTSCSPNGSSEQPQRRPGVRERFRAVSASSRCTAVREKRPDSWAFQRRSVRGETVVKASWRRERNCRRTLSDLFSIGY